MNPLLAQANDNTNLIYVIVGALAALGVLLMLVAIWTLRRTRPDPAVLGPLEVMGDRSWRHADDDERRDALDAARIELPEPDGNDVDDDADDADDGVVDHVASDDPDLGASTPDRGVARPESAAAAAATSSAPVERPRARYGTDMATLDTDAMIERFRHRAQAVKQRPLPPVAGEERQEFIAQAKLDFQDFAMIGDADASVDDGVLVLRIDLRPESAS